LTRWPLINYWRRGGRCRTCGARLSKKYFAIEVNHRTGIHGALLSGSDPRYPKSRSHASPGVRRPTSLDAQRRCLEGLGASLCLVLFLVHWPRSATWNIEKSLWESQFPAPLSGFFSPSAFPWPWPHGILEAYDGIQPGIPWYSEINHIVGGIYPVAILGAAAKLVRARLQLANGPGDRRTRGSCGLGDGLEYPICFSARPWASKRWGWATPI